MDLYNPIPIHIGTNNATANFQPTSHIQMCTQQDIRSVATYEHVCYKKKTPTCVPQLFLKKELTAYCWRGNPLHSLYDVVKIIASKLLAVMLKA